MVPRVTPPTTETLGPELGQRARPTSQLSLISTMEHCSPNSRLLPGLGPCQNVERWDCRGLSAGRADVTSTHVVYLPPDQRWWFAFPLVTGLASYPRDPPSLDRVLWRSEAGQKSSGHAGYALDPTRQQLTEREGEITRQGGTGQSLYCGVERVEPPSMQGACDAPLTWRLDSIPMLSVAVAIPCVE